MKKKIIVIGGGITGLSTAFRLQELINSKNLNYEITILEKSSRLGGVISTSLEDGFVIEMGPDSFITSKPWAIDLSKRLGLENEIISTNEKNRNTYVLINGELIKIPYGFFMIAPTNLIQFLKSPLFSWKGKIRILMEPFIPKKNAEDESVASFIERRLGKEALLKAADPLISGIYTADSKELSIKSTFPQFLEYEEKYGSIIKGLKRSKNSYNYDPKASGARYGLFCTFKDGMKTIVDKLEDKLTEADINLLESAVKIEKIGDKWEIFTDKQKQYVAEGLIITSPSHTALGLIHNIDPGLSDNLSAIECASSAVVILGYNKKNVNNPIDGFGFVVPRSEKSNLIACSITSNKFNNRAPDGYILLRCFVGGVLNKPILNLEDKEIISKVHQEISNILQIRGEAIFSKISRYDKSMPQYNVGHYKLVLLIKSQIDKLNGLEIAGNAYDGVGIPDCINSGEKAAESLITQLI